MSLDGNLNPIKGIPRELFTGFSGGTERIKVDSQQSSFESNSQFRFFDELSLPKIGGSQIVYRVKSVNPFVLFSRVLSFYQGGATYRVYADDGSHAFDNSLLGSPVTALPVNGDLSCSGLSAHPASSITLERADGNDIFVNGSAVVTGTSARAGTNSQQSSGALASDQVRLGFPVNFSGYVVITVIDGLSDESLGEYELFFEERF